MQKLHITNIHTNPLPFSMKHEVKKNGYIKGDQMMLGSGRKSKHDIYDFALKVTQQLQHYGSRHCSRYTRHPQSKDREQ